MGSATVCLVLLSHMGRDWIMCKEHQFISQFWRLGRRTLSWLRFNVYWRPVSIPMTICPHKAGSKKGRTCSVKPFYKSTEQSPRPNCLLKAPSLNTITWATPAFWRRCMRITAGAFNSCYADFIFTDSTGEGASSFLMAWGSGLLSRSFCAFVI